MVLARTIRELAGRRGAASARGCSEQTCRNGRRSRAVSSERRFLHRGFREKRKSRVSWPITGGDFKRSLRIFLPNAGCGNSARHICMWIAFPSRFDDLFFPESPLESKLKFPFSRRLGQFEGSRTVIPKRRIPSGQKSIPSANLYLRGRQLSQLVNHKSGNLQTREERRSRLSSRLASRASQTASRASRADGSRPRRRFARVRTMRGTRVRRASTRPRRMCRRRASAPPRERHPFPCRHEPHASIEDLAARFCRAPVAER